MNHNNTFHAQIVFSFRTHWYQGSEVYNSTALLTPSRKCYTCVGLILSVSDFIIIIITIITIIIFVVEFLTFQLWLGNIHLSWDVVINRIRLGGLICSLKSFLQLNMGQELQILAVVYMYSGAS